MPASEVVDRVEARIVGARVLRPVRRTAARRDLHGRRVVDGVAVRVAAAVERVVEREPVTRLVHRGEAEVVAVRVRVGRVVHGLPVDDDAVEVLPRVGETGEVGPTEVRARCRRVVGWETLTFSVPWLTLGLIFLVVYVVSLATTLAPALRASRVYPAEALRYQ
jgi:hypothetical protein